MLRNAVPPLITIALILLLPVGCTPDADPNTPDPVLEVSATAAPAQVSVASEGTLSAVVSGTTESVTYLWQQVDGPGVTLTGRDQATTTFVAPSLSANKVLRFQVIAQTAETAATARATLSVTILADPNYGPGNERPAANAGEDQTVLPGTTVTLDGSGSTGFELEYRWRQVSGTSVALSAADTVTASFTAPTFVSGGTNTVVFELTVTDAQNRAVTDRVQVKMRDPSLSDTQVRLKTSKGDIVIELDPNAAPITVANFLQYVDDGFYDGTIFHRVIPEFVIQGGGFEPGLQQKETRDPIKNEADNGLSNTRGTISMARTNDPDSATSQFFINVADNIAGGDGISDLDPGGVSPEGYAVFGEVVEGMDVVDEIVSVETTTDSGYQDVPVEDILIESVARVPRAEEI